MNHQSIAANPCRLMSCAVLASAMFTMSASAASATGLEDASFVLDDGAGAVDAARTRLEWDGDALTLFIKGGFMMVVK